MIVRKKHGGHERIIDESGYFKAPKACELLQEGRWLKLKVRGGEMVYPRPDNFVPVGGKTKFAAGEIIGTAYETTSPIYKLNALIKLMRAKGLVIRPLHKKVSKLGEHLKEDNTELRENLSVTHRSNPKSTYPLLKEDNIC